MKKYYEVKTKCGHVGKMNCIWIKFAIAAESGKEAANMARQNSRVKRHHKEAIRYVRQITLEEFCRLKEENRKNPYLNCHNIQEQNRIEGIEELISIDEENTAKATKKARKVDYAYRFRRYELESQSRYAELMAI